LIKPIDTKSATTIEVFKSIGEIFSQKEINILVQNFIVQTTWKVCVVQGRDFDPMDVEYSGSIPKGKEFIVYHFKKERKALKDYRLFCCTHKDCK